MIGWLKSILASRQAKREAEDAMYLRQAQADQRERQAFVERMIDRTARGLVDWTQPVAIGGGLFACHYRDMPSCLFIGPWGAQPTQYLLIDARAAELKLLILRQQAGFIRLVS